DARPAFLLVPGDDVEAGAEVLARTGEQDGAHGLVTTSEVDGVDGGVHHRVVHGVALLGARQAQRQDACLDRDVEAWHRLVRAHGGANASLIAVSAVSRSRAPRGGWGSRTGPCSRDGSRMVAVPGVVTTPRWFTAASSSSTAGRSPGARYLRTMVP